LAVTRADGDKGRDTCVCLHTLCMCTSVYLHVCIHIYEHICVLMYIWIYVCIYTHIQRTWTRVKFDEWWLSIYIYIYIYIYVNDREIWWVMTRVLCVFIFMFVCIHTFLLFTCVGTFYTVYTTGSLYQRWFKTV
jgi:hypothetical protein